MRVEKGSTPGKLIIHAGLHKTGTTTLQHFLFQNRELLKRYKVLYPFDDVSHWKLAEAAGLTKNDPESNYGFLWDDLYQLSAEYPDHHILLSAEDFSLVQTVNRTDIVDAFFQKIRGLGREIEVILYFRRQDRWIESLYLEYLKHLWKVDLNRFVGVRRALLDYNRVLAYWQRHLGENDIVRPRIFEKSMKRDICIDFLDAIGISDSDHFESVNSANHRYSLLQVQLLNGIISKIQQHLMPGSMDRFFFPLHAIRPLIDEFIAGFSDEQSTFNYHVLPFEVANKIMREASSSNLAIAQAWFPERNGELFSEPLVPYAHEPLDWPHDMSQELKGRISVLWQAILAELDVPEIPCWVDDLPKEENIGKRKNPDFYSVRLSIDPGSLHVQEFPPEFGDLSFLNGQPIQEEMELNSELIRIQGWAVIPDLRKPAKAVIAFINEVPYLAMTKIDRPDVAAHFGSKKLRYTGFLVCLPLTAFKEPINTLRFIFCGDYPHKHYSVGKQCVLRHPTLSDETERSGAAKLILHIGPPKTGTTSLQHFLRKNAKVLSRKGFLYPFNDFDHRQLAYDLGFGIVPPSAPPSLHREWTNLRVACRKASDRSFILSAEAFFMVSHPLIGTDGKLKMLIKALKTIGRPVDIVLYFRRLDLWLESFYIEHLKHFLVFTPDEFARQMHPLCDFERIISFWQQLPNVNQVILRPFRFSEDFDIRHDYLKALGLSELENNLIFEEAVRNDRPNDLQLQLLYRYMNLFLQLFPTPPPDFNQPFGPMDKVVGSFLWKTKECAGSRDYRLLNDTLAFPLIRESARIAQCYFEEYSWQELLEEWQPKGKLLDLEQFSENQEWLSIELLRQAWITLWEETFNLLGTPDIPDWDLRIPGWRTSSHTDQIILTNSDEPMQDFKNEQDWLSQLSTYRNIIVSGPQRSGTTFMGFALGKTLGIEYYMEESVENDNLDRLKVLLELEHPKVIQCPALCHVLDLINREDTLIVLMKRELSAIRRSELRVNWNQSRKRNGVAMTEAEYEKFKYLSRISSTSGKEDFPSLDFSAPIAAIKYEFWEKYQKARIPHPLEVDYDSLKDIFPDLWVDASGRLSFGPRQVEQSSDGMHAKLYVDTGSGFNERESMESVVRTGINNLVFDLSEFRQIKALRFDPLAIPASLRVINIFLGRNSQEKYRCADYSSNADFQEHETLFFAGDDPNIFISKVDFSILNYIEIDFQVYETGVELIPVLMKIIGKREQQASPQTDRDHRIHLESLEPGTSQGDSSYEELQQVLPRHAAGANDSVPSNADEMAQQHGIQEMLSGLKDHFHAEFESLQGLFTVQADRIEEHLQKWQDVEKRREEMLAFLPSFQDRLQLLQDEKWELKELVRSSLEARDAMESDLLKKNSDLEELENRFQQAQHELSNIKELYSQSQESEKSMEDNLKHLREIVSKLETARWMILQQGNSKRISQESGRISKSFGTNSWRRLLSVQQNFLSLSTGLIRMAGRSPSVVIQHLSSKNIATLVRAIRNEPPEQILRNANRLLMGRVIPLKPAKSSYGKPGDQLMVENFDAELVHSRKVKYYIDQVEEFEYHISVRGWIFSETHIIKSLFLRMGRDDTNPSSLIYQLERSDVFHHFGHRHAISSGFSEQIEKIKTGQIDLTLELVFEDGAKTSIFIGTVTLSEPRLSSLHSYILSNKAGFVSNLAGMPLKPRMTVGVYTNSKGNYFFHEIKHLIVAGLESAGYKALNLTEADGFSEEALLHVVIAPHEFFLLGAGEKLVRKTPKGLILLNTEQPSSEWFRVCTEYFRLAVEIWDMNYYSWKRMLTAIPTAKFLPLGYVPAFSLFGEVPKLPENYCTCFLDPDILKKTYLDVPFEQRPIDILFVGHASPRRQQFFARHAEFFSRYNCYFHLTDLSLGPVLVNSTSMNTQTAIGLAQRAKIVLNIHHGSQTYFEWHRMVIHGMWQKSLVISDLCSDSPPFQPGRDFIQASLEELPDLIEFFLSDPNGQKEANEIIRNAYYQLTTNCELPSILRDIINPWQEYPAKLRSLMQENLQETTG